MTIAILYRNGDEAFFLHDFRISHIGGKQIDAMMKYSSFGRRLGMFFAGDVAAFKRLIPYIRAVEPQVTINNVLDPTGPLATEIESYMMKNPDGLTGQRKVDILGFILDHHNKMNECFHIRAEIGMGSLLTPAKQNEVIVIRSGNAIPEISLKLTNITNQAIFKGYDIESTHNAARTHLKDIFQRSGASSYNKLGISPVFAGSVLKRGYFNKKIYS